MVPVVHTAGSKGWPCVSEDLVELGFDAFEDGVVGIVSFEGEVDDY